MDYTQNLGYWIKQYTQLANRAMDTELRPYGIGRTQWYILYHVNAVKTVSQRELQATLHVESATLTPLVASLVGKDLIRQTADSTDKRGKSLSLTPKGESLWRSLPDPIEGVKSSALRGIAHEDIIHARETLKKAVANLQKGVKE